MYRQTRLISSLGTFSNLDQRKKWYGHIGKTSTFAILKLSGNLTFRSLKQHYWVCRRTKIRSIFFLKPFILIHQIQINCGYLHCCYKNHFWYPQIKNTAYEYGGYSKLRLWEQQDRLNLWYGPIYFDQTHLVCGRKVLNKSGEQHQCKAALQIKNLEVTYRNWTQVFP